MSIRKISLDISEKTSISGHFDFSSDPPSTLKLTDQVLLYNLDDQWKIIPILFSLHYPLIYDNASTIVLCPITLRCVLLKGYFLFEKYDGYNMILKEKNTNNLISFDNQNYSSDIVHKRSEIKIITFRSSLMIAPDPLYIVVPTNINIDSIINLEYYNNIVDIDGNSIYTSIHPKTLIYVIQYKSFKSGKNKISLILGRDINKKNVTGYDLKKSGLLEYLNKYQQKIVNKYGFTMPMLWYVAKDLYGSAARVVYID
jgi:hypothetical protein